MPVPNWNANITPETAADQALHTRFTAIEQGLRALYTLMNQAAAATPDAPAVDWSAGTEGKPDSGGGGGGGGTDVEPGTIDGQVLRWNDADQVWEPAENVLIGANGDITIDATELITSQANANAFVVREKSGGQSQPVAVFQTESGFSAIRFTPSAALLRVLPGVTGAGLLGSDGFQGAPTFLGRRAQGTTSAPSATLSGNRLVTVQGLGYTSAGYESSPPGAFELVATENHTPTAWGTRASVKTTPNGTTTAAEGLGVEENGDVTTPGKIRATDGLGVGNSTAASALGTLIDVFEVFDETGSSLGYVPVYDSFS